MKQETPLHKHQRQQPAKPIRSHTAGRSGRRHDDPLYHDIRDEPLNLKDYPIHSTVDEMFKGFIDGIMVGGMLLATLFSAKLIYDAEYLTAGLMGVVVLAIAVILIAIKD